eukprot:jgi/Chrzof1/3884/Cz13g12030.t1
MVQQAMHDADMPWVCCTALQLNKMQDSVDVHPFEWGSDATHLQGPYDIIICSDLTYDVSSAPQLLASLQALSDESTIILMSFEIRPGLDKFLGSYLPDCTCFRPARVPYEDLHEDWRSPNILVYGITKITRIQDEQPAGDAG